MLDNNMYKLKFNCQIFLSLHVFVSASAVSLCQLFQLQLSISIVQLWLSVLCWALSASAVSTCSVLGFVSFSCQSGFFWGLTLYDGLVSYNFDPLNATQLF